MMKTVLSLNESPITSNRLITDTSTHLKIKSTYIRHINTSNVPYTQQNTIRNKIAEKFSSDIQFPLVKRKLTSKRAVKSSAKNVQFRVVSNEKRRYPILKEGKQLIIQHIILRENHLIRSLLLHLSRNIQRNIVLCLNLISLKISLFPLLKQNNV